MQLEWYYKTDQTISKSTNFFNHIFNYFYIIRIENMVIIIYLTLKK